MKKYHHILILMWVCFASVALAEPSPSSEPVSQKDVICGMTAGEFDGVERVNLHSNAVQQEVCYLVVRPDPERAKPEGGYPLLILLHGLHGGPGDWVRFSGILNRIEAAGTKSSHPLPPMLIVIPLGKNGYWTNWNGRDQRWRDWVTHELIKDIENRFPDVARVPEKRALAGYSMGGFGALSIALQYPGLFHLAIAMSPTDMDLAILGKGQKKVYRRVFGKDLPLSRIHQFNPYHQVLNGAGKGQSFFVAFGSNEAAKFKEGGIRLTAAMKEQGIDLSSHQIAGGTHSFNSTWGHPTIDSFLRWLSIHWKAGASTTSSEGEVVPPKEPLHPSPQKKVPPLQNK